MTNKRIHSNGRYAKRFNTSTGDSYTLYQKDIAKCRITEQELKDFWFEPVPDVFAECAEEIVCSRWWTLDEFNEAKEILKKHFQRYVDAYKKDI